MLRLETCPLCKVQYPGHLLSAIVQTGKPVFPTEPICAICADVLFTGVLGRPLSGRVSLDLKRQAEEWRRVNNYAPQEKS